MSDRIFAAAWLAVTAVIAWLTWQIQVPFSYEPIGPRAFPWMLCILMAACALRLVQRPDGEPDWPRGALLAKSAAMLVALLAYAFVFEWLGFPLATVLMVVAVGRVFGGRWVPCIVTGIVFGIGLWFFFDKLLDVTLPLGVMFART